MQYINTACLRMGHKEREGIGLLNPQLVTVSILGGGGTHDVQLKHTPFQHNIRVFHKEGKGKDLFKKKIHCHSLNFPSLL